MCEISLFFLFLMLFVKKYLIQFIYLKDKNNLHTFEISDSDEDNIHFLINT